MKRRETLKALTLGSLSGLGLLSPEAKAEVVQPADTPVVVPGGRTKEEAIRDAALMKEKFFTEHEMQTVRLLTDIIIPADSHSGSATQAKVPEFIEFMMKDQPRNQTPCGVVCAGWTTNARNVSRSLLQAVPKPSSWKWWTPLRIPNKPRQI